MPDSKAYHHTPDGRYFIVRGRLWRCSNPNIAETTRAALVKELMDARRTLRKSSQADQEQRRQARNAVQQAKEALGERGAVWWNDGAADYNRRLVENTPYRDWYIAQIVAAD